MTIETLTLQQQRERSALVVALPNLAHLIQDIRRQATEDGPAVPPHITLYSPFFAPAETTDETLERIARTLGAFGPFEACVERIERFSSGVWYLQPTPADPLQNIVNALRREFVEITPYWDSYPEVIPHITLADENVIGEDVAPAFADTVSRSLPVHLDINTVTWLQRRKPSPAPWDTIATFPLTSI